MTRTRIAAPEFSAGADAMETAQQPEVDLNPGTKGQEYIDLEPAVSPRDMETAAFYEQPVTIFVHENHEDIGTLVLSYNGEDGIIPRGRAVTVKRKFVQQLLDMRETKFAQPGRDQMNVERGNRLLPKTTLMYPFSVQSDPHPHGGAWLQTELRKQHSVASRLR
jgi:hypothetical protein